MCTSNYPSLLFLFYFLKKREKNKVRNLKDQTVKILFEQVK